MSDNLFQTAAFEEAFLDVCKVVEDNTKQNEIYKLLQKYPEERLQIISFMQEVYRMCLRGFSLEDVDIEEFYNRYKETFQCISDSISLVFREMTATVGMSSEPLKKIAAAVAEAEAHEQEKRRNFANKILNRRKGRKCK